MIRALGVVIAALVATPVAAVDLTFSNLCPGYTLRQTSTMLEVRCPGVAQPVLRFDGCIRASARWDRAAGKIIITCGAGSTFGLKSK